MELLKRVPRFRRVCFCMPLRCGLIFLVYLNLVISTAVIFLFGGFDVYKFIYRMFTLKREGWLMLMRKTKLTPLTVVILLSACFLAESIMTVVALISIHQRREKLLKIYLYYAVAVAFFILFFRMMDLGHYWYIDLAVTLLFLVMKLYYILVLRSHVKVMTKTDVTSTNTDINLDGDAATIEMAVTASKDDKNEDNVSQNVNYDERHPLVVVQIPSVLENKSDT